MTVQDDDQFLVSRNSTPYNLKSQNVMAELLDDDLMLVCRNGTPYKATGLEVKDSLGPPLNAPIIDTVALSEVDLDGDRFTGKSFSTAINCKPISSVPITYELKGTSEGTLVKEPTTSVITGLGSSRVPGGFAPVTYTGNGSAQSITGVGFSPDLIWAKCRDVSATPHYLVDSVRGANHPLYSDSTLGEGDTTSYYQSFDADGFTVGSGIDLNGDGRSLVAWCWDAGDTTVANNEGTIESQVRSNGDFSIVSYVGNATAGATVGHGLNAAPAMMIVKRLDNTNNWRVGHNNMTSWAYNMNLESSVAESTTSDVWNSTDPTSSVFSIGLSNSVNAGSGDYIAYIWAESPSQNFGSYTGNGSTTGPVIDCGFEPAFVLVKSSTLAKDWRIYDIARQDATSSYPNLRPNTADEEYDDPAISIKLTSTGFEVIGSDDGINASGATYIYAAFGGTLEGVALELTDDTDLDLFTPGMDINQDSSGTPVSTAITNVADVDTPDYPSQTTNVNDMQSYGSISKIFDGSLETNAQLDPNTGITAWSGFSVSPAITGSSIRLYCKSSSTGNPTTDNIRINGSKVYSAQPSYSWLSINQASVTKIEGMTFGGGGTYLAAIEVDGSVLIANATLNTLTLTDDTNLANFRVGDVVQGPQVIVGSPYEARYGTSESATWNNSVFVENLTIGQAPTESLIKSVYLYDFNSPVSGIEFVRFAGQLSDPTYSFNMYISDDGIAWSLVMTTDSINGEDTSNYPKFESLTPARFYKIVRSDGDNMNFDRYGFTSNFVQAKINAIDEAAPSITTVGGSWSGADGSGDPAGETFVTGPVISAASGTVASTDLVAKTMNLSVSSGRWLVTKPGYLSNKKLNKTAVGPTSTINNVKLYTIFDAEGNISDLSEVDPGYRPIVSGGSISESLELTFPNVLPNGKTPDETLPQGATLCVDVKADNDGGTDYMLHEESGACVTPEGSGPGPKAVMNGLRFDSARDTFLSRTPSSAGNRKTWTWSGWVKRSVLGTRQQLFSAPSGNTYIEWQSDNKIQLEESVAGIFVIKLRVSDVQDDTSGWYHFVIQLDTTQATEADRAKIYINGVLQTTFDTAIYPSQNHEAGINSAGTHKIGAFPEAGDNGNFWYLDGYLSEYYFVDGQALPPETFGYDYENQGKWAPLDKAVIKQNIEDAKAAAFPDANTSQVWSNYFTTAGGWFSGQYDNAKAFDGNPSTYANPAVNTPAVFSPPGGIDAITSIELLVKGKVVIDGVEKTDTGNVDPQVIVINDVASFNTLEIERTAPDVGAQLSYIKINNQLLIDGGFGAGGFYLPFDPAAVGVNYSDGPQTGIVNAPGWSTVFDGTLSDMGTNNNGVSSLTLSNQITFSNLRIYAQDNPVDSSLKVYVNGSVITGLTTSMGWLDITSQVTSPVVSLGVQGNGGANSTFIGSVEVDGEILFDYNSIGVDDSGNENNFHDQNFAVGGNTSQVWSSNVSGTFLSGSSASAMFNGSSSDSKTYLVVDTSFTYTGEVTVTTSFSVLASTYTAQGGQITIDVTYLDDSTQTITLNTNPRDNQYWDLVNEGFDVSKGGFKKLVWSGTSDDPGNWSSYYWTVDGELLVDANQVDTVTDTPLKNYATLLTGANGNLKAKGDTSITYLGEVGTDYYYEEDGNGKVHTGGGTFSSVLDKTYNFGQQPFATDGYDDSQVYSSGVVTGTANAYKLFDGNLDESATVTDGAAGASYSIKLPSPVTASSKVEIYVEGNANGEGVRQLLNGGSVVATLTPSITKGWQEFPSSNVTFDEITSARDGIDGGGNSGVRVDGRVLVDTGNPLVAAYGNTLFQTWEQWNNVATLRADNPVHAAKFEAIKNALEAYPEDKRAFRTQLATKAASVLTAEEAAVVAQLLG